MQIGGFQKLTLLDYPGKVACIVFTKGCSFRCPFCYNADLVLPDGHTDPCTEADVLRYLTQRRHLLEGVVVTGGEPLLQPDLPAFLEEVRALGLSIKLDTNGSFPKRLQALLEQQLISYVAMDIKHAPDGYGAATGLPNNAAVSLVEESLQTLQASGVPFELRTTVVQGIHTQESLRDLAQWLQEKLRKPVPWYLQSYQDEGRIIAPGGLSAFSPTELQQILAKVQRFWPDAALRNAN